METPLSNKGLDFKPRKFRYTHINMSYPSNILQKLLNLFLMFLWKSSSKTALLIYFNLFRFGPVGFSLFLTDNDHECSRCND